MTNLEKYNKLFLDAFPLTEGTLSNATYRKTPRWDSLAHMDLISSLEEAFCISMETLDVMDFSSYEKGKTVLAKYGVEIP